MSYPQFFTLNGLVEEFLNSREEVADVAADE